MVNHAAVCKTEVSVSLQPRFLACLVFLAPKDSKMWTRFLEERLRLCTSMGLPTAPKTSAVARKTACQQMKK